MIAVRRSEGGAWHLVPAAVPLATSLCGRWIARDEVVDVVEHDLLADLMAGVECCRDCRVAGEALEVSS